MGGHKVWDGVLLLACRRVCLLILIQKLLIDLMGWFSHIVKYLVGNVFRRDTKLSAYMVFHKFLQKNWAFVRYYIVKSDSGADENFLDSGDLAEFPKKCHVIGMVYGKVSARFREKTLPVLADTFGELLLTGWLPEVCGRASDIMDIALEIRIMSHFFCFFENGLMTSRLENASLMERQSTEITAAETAPVARQAEFDLLQSRDSAFGVIHRMPGILIGKVVNIVHLLLAQWKCRRVLDHASSISVALCHRSGSKRVGISVLLGKAFGIGFFVRRYCLIGRKDDRIISARQIFALINGSRNESDLIYRKAALKRLRDLDDRMLSHSIRNKIRPGIQKDTAAHLVFPIIIVCEASKACLDPAQDDRCMFIRLTDQVTVHHGRHVRAQSHLAAW